MKKYYRFPIFLVLTAGLSSVGFANSNCVKDSECGRGEICCAFKRCRQTGNCIACIIDSHCPKGEKCFNSHCTRSHDFSTESVGEKSCSTDKDCYYNSEQQLNCCQGKCTKYSCSSPYATTQPTTVRASCISWRDCSHGEQCEKGSCKKTSNVMLTKAGFLSAAILTGSVFLLILCCCFVRESKYSRQRYAERQRRRSRSRSRRRRSTQQLRPRSSTTCTTTSVENRAFSLDESNACEGGLPPPEYPGGSSTTDGVLSPVEPAPVTPPPYYTLSFDLPPTYEEALQDEEDRGSSLATVT